MQIYIDVQRLHSFFCFQLCAAPITGSDQMYCKSPNITYRTQNITAEEPLITQLRFTTNSFKVFDGLDADVTTLVYYRDPIFYPFPSGEQYIDVSDDELMFLVIIIKTTYSQMKIILKMNYYTFVYECTM